jgi:serine-type D-Ala-D-Ala carboxypeptidase/endopeptidase
VRALTTRRTDPYADWDAARLEAAIPRTRPRREPEQRFRYSNYGVGLLGYLLARRAGTSYDELVRQRIAHPLGLHDTGTQVDAGRLATPHRLSGREASHWHFDALAGAGALRSTATDLLGFLRLHADRSDRPLAAAARETQRPRTKVGRGHIGLGWMIFPPVRRFPFELLLHEGGTGGFRAFAGLAPERELGVVVLTNQARGVGGLGLRLLRAASRR